MKILYLVIGIILFVLLAIAIVLGLLTATPAGIYGMLCILVADAVIAVLFIIRFFKRK